MRRLRRSGLLLGLLVPLAVWAQADDSFDADYDGRFAFTRVRYGSGRGRGGSWAHDYPRADEHLPRIIADLTTIRPRVDAPTKVLDLEDPRIFLSPILYISEPGFWTVTDAGAANLRAHLL